MSKYSGCLKRAIVERCVNGEESYRSAGQRAAGLSKKFSHNDAAFKLSVLKRMWEDGLSYRQTAALFNIRNAG
ncbi:hypothetical protein J2Z31_005926 [Sinorhizobium kostiense]|uniref:Transposase n=1 Tax=Sinorhizobium kostiense TaxID=76747 RepID=A0ABS4R912_9HYPH|nr:hypothetical protein [Sinorhizobium kostiense]